VTEPHQPSAVTPPPAAAAAPPAQPAAPSWHELELRVAQLEADRGVLEQEIKALRQLLERVIEHRQKSHGELVLLLTTLVSKLPLTDIGGLVGRLVEHNSSVSQYLASLAKGTAELDVLPQPTALATLDHTKRDLAAAIKPLVEELLRLEIPLEKGLLEALPEQPELFFSPRMLRACRCFVKGCLPKERIVREFGEAALPCFNDLTTDPKLNPRPKPDEIVLGFKSDFETLVQQVEGLTPEKREGLLKLYRSVQSAKTTCERALAQRNAFCRLSFIVELWHYYEHQTTEAPDVVFAQRLPGLVEQLVLPGAEERLDENLIAQAETLLAYVINPDHRLMVINNIGKGGGAARTLRYVLRLRAEKLPETDLDHSLAEFARHLIPAQGPPKAEAIAAVLKLLKPPMQQAVLRALRACDRLRKDVALSLAKAVAAALGLPEVAPEAQTAVAEPPEMERKRVWAGIKDMITRRAPPATIAASIRDRLNAKYNADEVRESWIVLTEADPMLLIRIICHLPYLANGKTDPIARPVIETYVTRLLHEKYAATYQKVLRSRKSMYAAKPDSPTLLTFTALVKWASPEAAQKLCADIGMPVPA